jgi:hypothetical protein
MILLVGIKILTYIRHNKTLNYDTTFTSFVPHLDHTAAHNFRVMSLQLDISMST